MNTYHIIFFYFMLTSLSSFSQYKPGNFDQKNKKTKIVWQVLPAKDENPKNTY
jgi:hypothetical protein